MIYNTFIMEFDNLLDCPINIKPKRLISWLRTILCAIGALRINADLSLFSTLCFNFGLRFFFFEIFFKEVNPTELELTRIWNLFIKAIESDSLNL